jgi:hypothetical protein
MWVRNGCQVYLVFRILGDLVESSNVELEFAAFAEFSEAGTKGDEVCSCDRDAQTHRGFRHIVDLVLVQPEAIGLVLAVDEVDKILALWMKLRQAGTDANVGDVQCNLRVS